MERWYLVGMSFFRVEHVQLVERALNAGPPEGMTGRQLWDAVDRDVPEHSVHLILSQAGLIWCVPLARRSPWRPFSQSTERPMAKTRNLFISHAFSYRDAYEGLCKLLDASSLEYHNYSVPEDDPVHDAAKVQQLYEAIKHHIAPCHAVLMMAGKYASYSKWMAREIQIAKRDYDKPIVAICPWGAQQISAVVRKSADRIARWNTASIVEAIRDVC